MTHFSRRQNPFAASVNHDGGLVVAPPTDADVTGSTVVLVGMLNGNGESLAVWRQEVVSNTALMLSFYFGNKLF